MNRDVAMPLGAHLEELRWRLIRIVIFLFFALIAGFVFNVELKLFVVEPLRQAIQMAGPDISSALGLPTDPDATRILKGKSLADPAITSFTVALMAALFATFPYIVFQIWGFIAPALKHRETGLAFLFLPTAVIFFYLGTILGYYFGLPWFYVWLLQWAAADPTVEFILEQRHYLRFFMMLTICFGIILDIPWFVLLLVRLRVVSIGILTRYRRFVILAAIILAAVLSPPDPFSQIALFIPMVLLYEVGIILARLFAQPRGEDETSEEESA